MAEKKEKMADTSFAHEIKIGRVVPAQQLHRVISLAGVFHAFLPTGEAIDFELGTDGTSHADVPREYLEHFQDEKRFRIQSVPVEPKTEE